VNQLTPLHRRRFLQAGVLAGTGLAADPAPAAAASNHPPRFRLGLVTYNLAASWDLDAILKVCKAVGISPVELRTTHKHGVEPALDSRRRKDVRRRFTESGVELWGCGTVCEFHSPDPAVVRRNIETCKRFIDLVTDLGGRGVKVRPNGLPKDVEVAKTLEQIGRALAECGRAAADAGVEVWLEVHGPGTSHPPHVRTIMQHCDHPSVGVTWNSNRDDVQDGSVAGSVGLLGPWIRSCHINELYKDSLGRYPYRELFRLLRERGYERATLCEVGLQVPDTGAGAEFLRYYKALWQELNRS
jgi:sugar phosphate isomerase/epimerase